MQNLDFIDTLTDEVLTEMLELISLDYNNFNVLFEEVLCGELMLIESIDSVQIKKEQRERTDRLRAAAKKGTRLRAKQQTTQSTERVNSGVKGKYDRRPWYKKAFNKLKKWVGKGVEALKDRNEDEDDTETVYNAPTANARKTHNTTTPTKSVTEPPKQKTDTHKRAETLRAKRQADKTKKQSNFKSFRKKAQESRFKRMASPLSPAALIKKKAVVTPPENKTPEKQTKKRLNITNKQGQSTVMRP